MNTRSPVKQLHVDKSEKVVAMLVFPKYMNKFKQPSIRFILFQAAVAVVFLVALYVALHFIPGYEFSFSVNKKVERIQYERSAGAGAWLTSPSIGVYNFAPPVTAARSYIIGDLQSGQILEEKRSDEVYPIASITKLMTAVVAEEVFDPKKKISITEDILRAYGKTGGLVEGEKITARDILYPLLMESSNDAAKAISSTFGESPFITLMQKRADDIGMYETTFQDAAGMGAKNVSNAQDLFKLAQYIHTEKPFVFEITKLPSKIFSTRGTYHELRNANLFVKDSRFLGGKVGYTDEAKQTMIALFELPTKNATHTIAFIILGSNNRESDIGKLVGWFQKAAY